MKEGCQGLWILLHFHPTVHQTTVGCLVKGPTWNQSLFFIGLPHLLNFYNSQYFLSRVAVKAHLTEQTFVIINKPV